MKSLEKKIDELIKKSSRVPPFEIINLLKRADMNSHIDVKKELENLYKKYHDTTSSAD